LERRLLEPPLAPAVNRRIVRKTTMPSSPAPLTPFRFDNTYARELPDFCVAWPPAAVPKPTLISLNRDLEIGRAHV
jgi:hypothetical protein